MSRSAKIYSVLIASPSDVGAERNIIREVLFDWNSANSLRTSVMLEPVMWEKNAARTLGESPQEVINQQLIDYCDFAVGVFWTRIGTPTAMAPGGAVEEIDQFRAAKKPVIVSFCDREIDPMVADIDQLAQVKEFRETCRKQGLILEYDSLEDFRYLIRSEISKTMSMILGIEEENKFTRKSESKDSAYRVSSDFERLQYQAALTKEDDLRAIDAGIRIIRRKKKIGKVSVLDVGCGNGVVTLSRFGDRTDAQVTAIDQSGSAIDFAIRNSKAPNISYKIKKFEDYDPKKGFDLVFCSYVLHHVGQPQAILQKIWALTNPGGVVIVRTFDDGLTIRHPRDEELDFVFDASQEIEGGSDRNHGRKFYSHVRSLLPVPQDIRLESNPTTTVNAPQLDKAMFYDFVFAFRPNYFRRLAEIDNATAADVKAYERVDSIVREKRKEFLERSDYFMMHAHMLWVIVK